MSEKAEVKRQKAEQQFFPFNGCWAAELAEARILYDIEMERIDKIQIKFGFGSVEIKKLIAKEDFRNRYRSVLLKYYTNNPERKLK